MNLKQKIEEWEIKESRNKLLSWEGGQHPYFIHENFLIDSSKNYNEIMQALKEAAEIMDKIGLEENEVNATLVKPTESDVELKILNAYLKDFWSAPRRWRKKWGFECG